MPDCGEAVWEQRAEKQGWGNQKVSVNRQNFVYASKFENFPARRELLYCMFIFIRHVHKQVIFIDISDEEKRSLSNGKFAQSALCVSFISDDDFGT